MNQIKHLQMLVQIFTFCFHFQISSLNLNQIGALVNPVPVGDLALHHQGCIPHYIFCLLTSRQGWIFFRICGYSIREKFPILGTSGKSFPILWSARVVGNCYSLKEILSLAWEPFPGRETFTYQGNISLKEKTFPSKEAYPVQGNLFSTGKPFSGRDIVIRKQGNLYQAG